MMTTMKIYLLSPNYPLLITAQLEKQLMGAGQLVVETKVKPFAKVKGLYSDDEPKILAIDPDFCNWQVPDEVISQVPNLKSICLQTTSFNWLNTDLAKKNSIPVMNIKGFSTQAVVEWALMMTRNLARKVPLISKKGWKKSHIKYQGIELEGKVAGIIGMGSIGTKIAELCQASGMRIQYWSKNSRDKRFWYVPLKKLMKTSDVIFPTVAINAKTKNLISNELLLSMKKEAMLVSIISVGKVFDHQRVLKMAAQGKLYGYAFEEDKAGGNLGKYKGNVWARPAQAWITDGSMRRNAEGWVRNITQAARGNYSQKIN